MEIGITSNFRLNLILTFKATNIITDNIPLNDLT